MRWLVRGEDALPADVGWLAAGEASYAAGLRYTKRRTEYLLRRLAAKHAVAGALGLPAHTAGGSAAPLARIEISHLPSGAPRALLDGAPCGLEISISDRAGWAVCLVSGESQAIGCDLELVEPRTSGFVRDFLTGNEQGYVAAQPDEEARDAAANLLWSAKESALKLLQTGLRRDTRSVEVTVHERQAGGWTAMTVRTVEGQAIPGWWRRDGSFLLTVSTTGPLAPPVAFDDMCRLADAVPRHSWLDRPLTDAAVSARVRS